MQDNNPHEKRRIKSKTMVHFIIGARFHSHHSVPLPLVLQFDNSLMSDVCQSKRMSSIHFRMNSVDFDQRVTGLDIFWWNAGGNGCPVCRRLFDESRSRTSIVPPAVGMLDCTVRMIAIRTISVVVVPVLCSERLAVRVITKYAVASHRISGVSAVPGNCQPVLTSLISDGERRVLSPVP